MRLLLALIALLLALPAHAARIKDIADVHGMRDNPLTGYGLVVGLQGTGDSQRNAATIRALATRLQGLGGQVAVDDIKSKNVALVMVQAELGTDDRTGQGIDVTVASTGDASSLEGGILLPTPLMVPGQQEAFALAQGPITLGGFAAGQDGTQTRKNIVTVGRIVGGATVEREVWSALAYDQIPHVDLVLKDPDLTTAARMEHAIDGAFGGEMAHAISSSTVRVQIPESYRDRFVRLMAEVLHIDVEPDARARVVINERTGTVVMGSTVSISPVAIAQGAIHIEIQRDNFVSQPAPFSQGTTQTQQNSWIDVQEDQGDLKLAGGSNVGELVGALNDLGVKPRDLISILQSIKAAGALHAELVVL